MNKILEIQGFGRNKFKKYGKGPPPKGWPVCGFPWANFKGATNSKDIGNSDVVRLICTLMEASGFNPNTHIEDEVLNARNPEVQNPVIQDLEVQVPPSQDQEVQNPEVQNPVVQDLEVQVPPGQDPEV